jgi:mannose-1-phosphate guanylyltransferase
VGVEPDRIETGYGHIQPGEDLATSAAVPAFRVRAFHEKPDAPTARRYVEAGYLWNSGIFVWTASRFLDEVARHAPEVASLLPLLDSQGAEAFFESVPVCVVDRAVMERSDRVACVKAGFAWDDVGNWEALARTHRPDPSGNFVHGSSSVVAGSGNVVWAEGGHVVLYGVDDLVVVRAGDTTLVMPRDKAGNLKDLLRELGQAT